MEALILVEQPNPEFAAKAQAIAVLLRCLEPRDVYDNHPTGVIVTFERHFDIPTGYLRLCAERYFSVAPQYRHAGSVLTGLHLQAVVQQITQAGNGDLIDVTNSMTNEEAVIVDSDDLPATGELLSRQVGK